MTPEKLLEWADIVKRTVEVDLLNEVIFELRQPLEPTPVFRPPYAPSLPDCGCPLFGYVCNSTACPRSYRITC